MTNPICLLLGHRWQPCDLHLADICQTCHRIHGRADVHGRRSRGWDIEPWQHEESWFIERTGA